MVIRYSAPRHSRDVIQPARSRPSWATLGLIALPAVAVLLLAITPTAAGIAPPMAGAIPAEPADLPFAEQLLRNCQLQLDSAASDTQRARAQECIDDQERVIAHLTGPTPTTPPTTTAGPAPTTLTSAPPTATATTVAPPTSTAPPTTTPPGLAWPTPANTGVPPFWQPTTTRSTDLRVTATGSIVQDVLLTNGADILVDAPNVTIRRVMLQGGRIDLSPGTACNQTRIEQTTIRRPTGTVTDADQEGRITPGGWTVDRVHLDGVPEGLRAGGKATCGPNSISNSFVRIQAPDVCADWHGDGIQGYDGGAVTVRNVVIDFQERGSCGGTAPFFYPRNQGNTSVDVDRLIVRGGGFSFRNGMPGRVVNLHVVDGSWGFGPVDVRCSVLTAWQASISRVDASWTPTVVRAQPCNTEGGF